MLLSFNNYRERKNADGKTFLDLECMLFTAEPKMTRMQISIPSSIDFDLTTPVHEHQMPTIHFYDQADGPYASHHFGLPAIPDQPLNYPSLTIQDLFIKTFKIFYKQDHDQ